MIETSATMMLSHALVLHCTMFFPREQGFALLKGHSNTPVYRILKTTGPYQLFLALYLVHSLSLQLFLGLQSSQTISFQAFCFLLGSSPFLLQLKGSSDLI